VLGATARRLLVQRRMPYLRYSLPLLLFAAACTDASSDETVLRHV
jgi:hypothetical protein